MAATPDPARGQVRHPTFGLWPVALRDDLRAQRAMLDEKREIVADKITDWLKQNGQRLTEAGSLLEAAEPYVNVQGAARTRGSLAVLQGWLPAADLDRAHRMLGTRCQMLSWMGHP